MLRQSSLLKATTGRDRKLQRRVKLLGINTCDYLARHKKRQFVFECHSIAMALSIVVPELRLVNGSYLGVRWAKRKGKVILNVCTCTHSWLVTPSGSIIDPYPVGVMTWDALLVATRGKYKPFGGGLYYASDKPIPDVSEDEIRRKSLYLACMILKANADPERVIK